MKIKYILMIFASILLLPIVMANPNWYDWGNQGSSVPNMGMHLYGSNFPAGNITEFTNINISQSSDYPPIIADLNVDGDNEIYLFEDNIVYQYDFKGDFLSSIVLSGNIFELPFIINRDDDNDLEIVIPVDSSSPKFDVIGFAPNFNLQNTYTITDSNYKYGISGNLLSDNVFVFAENCSYLTIDMNNGAETYFSSINKNSLCNQDGDKTFVVDLDKDGDVEHYFSSYSTDLIVLKSELDGSQSTLINESYSFGINNIFDFNYGNIGLKSSYNEIIISVNYFTGATNGQLTYIFDSLGNRKLRYSAKLKPSIIDFNIDGDNEFCGFTGANILCYDSSFTQIFSKSETDFNSNEQLTIGEFSNLNNTYQEVLCGDGIYYFNGSSFINIYTLNNIDTNDLVIPVSLVDRGNFEKDIVHWSPSKTMLHLNFNVTTVCGNDICEPSESPLTCPDDCVYTLSEDPEEIFLTKYKTNPSIGSTLLNGTTLQICVTLNSTTEPLTQYKNSIYFGTDNIIDGNWNSPVVAGIEDCQSYTVNLSGNYEIRLDYRVASLSTYNTSTYKYKSFNFSVDDEFGVEFGDSEYIFTGKETTIVSEATKTESANDNGITNAVGSISEQTGVAGVIVWLILMVIIAITLFVTSGMYKIFSFSVTVGVIGFVEAMMLIIGWLLGFIPASVMVIIIILCLTILILFMRNKFTGGVQ